MELLIIGLGTLRHDDHFRGVSHSYQNGLGFGGIRFNYVNPDFFPLSALEKGWVQASRLRSRSVVANQM